MSREKQAVENTSGNKTLKEEPLQDVRSIEDAFAMLDKILAKMDEEGVTLEESFDCYEQGMKLIRYCNETIDTVEKKVQILSAEGETDEF